MIILESCLFTRDLHIILALATDIYHFDDETACMYDC